MKSFCAMFQSSLFFLLQVERAPEEDLAETNQDHTEDSNVPGPSPKIKKGKIAKATPEITGEDGAEKVEEPKPSEPSPKASENEDIPDESATPKEAPVPEELKPSEPSPKAKKGKKNAKIARAKKGEEKATASEIGPEESAPPSPVSEELEPLEPSVKVKKGKRNTKAAPGNNDEGEASTSDVKPAVEEGPEESQIEATNVVSIPKESLLKVS